MDVHGRVHSGRVLILEDISEATVQLREKGYECDLTHSELLSSSGTEHTGKVFKGDYSLLWIRSPDDWHVRTVIKKTTAHWQRIRHWVQKSVVLGMILILFGPLGFP